MDTTGTERSGVHSELELNRLLFEEKVDEFLVALADHLTLKKVAISRQAVDYLQFKLGLLQAGCSSPDDG